MGISKIGITTHKGDCRGAEAPRNDKRIKTMTVGIIGKKLGMTQVFHEDGRNEAVTAIQAGPCTVMQVKTAEKEGYSAVQLGFGGVGNQKSAKRGRSGDAMKHKYIREFSLDETNSTIEITATVVSTGKTGVEMEALTATAVAALTIYDMCKAVDRGMKIENIRLTRKSGGKSGTIELE